MPWPAMPWPAMPWPAVGWPAMLGHTVQPVWLAWPKAPKSRPIAIDHPRITIFNGPGPFIVEVPDLDADLAAMRAQEYNIYRLQGRLRALARIHGRTLAELETVQPDAHGDYLSLKDRSVLWALKTLQETKDHGVREFMRD